MQDDWPAKLRQAAEREFGEQRAAELAGGIASVADAISRVLAHPLEPTDEAPYLAPPDQTDPQPERRP